jgi:hypothetical protein
MATLTTDQLIDAAAWATVRGSLLFHLDLAQALARDALPPGLEIGGWAVDVGAAGYTVIFLDADLVREIHAVTFAADGSPLGERRAGRAGPRATALAAARRTVLEQANDETIVVAPPPADARPGQPLEAYVLPSRLEAAERIVLSADGRRVTAAQPVAAGLVPTEVHVHASLKRGVALELVTPANGLRWRVEGESISRL